MFLNLYEVTLDFENYIWTFDVLYNKSIEHVIILSPKI